jgi:hypothetical protein
MKSYPVILLFLLSLFAYSCSDNLANIGSGIQPSSDQIKVGTDTFHVTTADVLVDFINSRPDSFLLGTFYDSKFGSTQADILAQLNCPEGFKFPPNTIADSASVVMHYRTWFGSEYSPLDVNIYEMNKGTFNYTSLYPTNLDIAAYTDRSIKLGEKIFSAKDAAPGRTDPTAIRFKLSSNFVQRFFDDSHYSSTKTFLDFFKGIFITANYGAATLLNIAQIDLRYYYHYTYTTRKVSGGDSIVTRNSYLIFPANSEVRQVNRFQHNDRASVIQHRDSVNYIASPANLQTRVNIPLNRIQQRIKNGVNGKKLTVNSALLKVEVTEAELDAALHPVVQHLLLVKESAKDRFFNNREFPSDTCAVRGDYTTAEIGNTGVYRHYYVFNIASLIVKELKTAEKNGTLPLENMKMLLVPVKITTATSSNGVVSYVSVKEDYLMSAATIRSGKEINPLSGDKVTEPMHINMVYSGF